MLLARSPLRGAASALALVLVAAPAAWAQEAAVPITEKDLLAPGEWGPREGKHVELSNVKFKDFFRPNVRLVKIPSDKLVLDGEQRRALADALAGWKTSTGVLDKKGRSNVKVVGIARNDSSAGRIIDVEDVVKLPDDVEQFRSRLEKIAGTDVDGRMRLAEEAVRRADFYGVDDLRDWAKQTYEGALDARRATLPKGDGKAAIELALKYRDLAGSAQKAIDLLGDVLADSATAEADHERALKLLENDLGAVLHRGKWVSREDFKTALGFVPRKDANGNVTWVRRERLEFEQVVAKQRELNRNDPNPRKLLGSQYEEAAKQGEVVVGMYKQEVVRTKGYGFPAFVDRFTEKGPSGEIAWDQWVMADGTRIYFMAQSLTANANWVAIAVKKKDEPLPKN